MVTCQEVEDDPGQVGKYQYDTRLEKEHRETMCKCCTVVGRQRRVSYSPLEENEGEM